jgi:RES domain-containing protein
VRLWRISNYADLTGAGGMISSGRWHSRGVKIVYLADHPASALLERLVHLEIDIEDVPSTYQLLAIETPDSLAAETVNVEGLPEDWRSSETATQPVGDDWLQGKRTALLRVPSAITPHTFNWLLNPEHPDSSALKVVEVITAPFDRRLFR